MAITNKRNQLGLTRRQLMASGVAATGVSTFAIPAFDGGPAEAAEPRPVVAGVTILNVVPLPIDGKAGELSVRAAINWTDGENTGRFDSTELSVPYPLSPLELNQAIREAAAEIVVDDASESHDLDFTRDDISVLLFGGIS